MRGIECAHQIWDWRWWDIVIRQLRSRKRPFSPEKTHNTFSMLFSMIQRVLAHKQTYISLWHSRQTSRQTRTAIFAVGNGPIGPRNGANRFLVGPIVFQGVSWRVLTFPKVWVREKLLARFSGVLYPRGLDLRKSQILHNFAPNSRPLPCFYGKSYLDVF